jgi:hypothetical protein
MWLETYITLCNTLQQNGFLRNARVVQAKQVAAFCLLMSHGWLARSMANMLQCSTYFISVYVRKTGRALYQLEKSLIQPNSLSLLHPNVANNLMYYSWFVVRYQIIVFYIFFNFVKIRYIYLSNYR